MSTSSKERHRDLLPLSAITQLELLPGSIRRRGVHAQDVEDQTPPSKYPSQLPCRQQVVGDVITLTLPKRFSFKRLPAMGE